MPKLSIVIPCYYQEDVIPITAKELINNEKNFRAGVEFEYVLVDDGSKDHTFDEILKFHNKYPGKVKAVKLSKNFGADNATLAGVNYATGDCCVCIGADMQDPPELIPQMFEYWEKGIKLVLANRTERKEPFFWKALPVIFHYIFKKFALANAPAGGTSLVLFDKQLRDIVVKLDEKNTFFSYLLISLGHDYVSIPYVRQKQIIGKSRWTTAKRVKSFIDAFVAFSFFPIRLITSLGFLLGGFAFIYGLLIIYSKIFGLVPVEGWSTLMIAILFTSAFQMIALGILGEYLWRTLDAVRKRPNFVVETVYDKSENQLPGKNIVSA